MMNKQIRDLLDHKNSKYTPTFYELNDKQQICNNTNQDFSDMADVLHEIVSDHRTKLHQIMSKLIEKYAYHRSTRAIHLHLQEAERQINSLFD